MLGAGEALGAAVVGVAAAFGGWEVAVVGVGLGSSVLTGFVDCPEPAGLAGLVCFVCLMCWVCLVSFACLVAWCPLLEPAGRAALVGPWTAPSDSMVTSDTGVDTPVTDSPRSRPRLA